MRRRPGFSLLELLVVITIFTLVLGAAGRLMVATQRAFVTNREASAVLVPLRQAEHILTELLQASGANPSAILSVTAPRVLPGIYRVAQARTGQTGYLRIVSDLSLPLGTSLNEEFEDVQTWVERDTLWVSWSNNGGGTPQAAQAVATPITNVQYIFQTPANTAIDSTVGKVSGAGRVLIRITSRRPDQPTTPIVREAWVLLRNP